MKTIFSKYLLAVCALLLSQIMKADDLTIGTFTMNKGETKTLSLNLTNTKGVSGFQVEITLPSGMTCESATINTTRIPSSYVSTYKLTPKISGTSVKLVCTSSSNKTASAITGTSGAVVDLTLKAGSTMAGGDKTITLSNKTVTNVDLSESEPANSSTKVHVHSLTATAAKAATCTATGNKAYWTCSTCNKVYSNSTATTETTVAAMTIAKIAHAYSAAPTAWSWGTDGKSATATFKCANCTQTESRTATITSAVKTPATCTVKGTTTYTASANSSTSTTKYTSTKDVQDIAVLGHSYGEPVWTWSDDGKTASAQITCVHDANHVLSGEATVTSAVKTAATCEAEGTTTYTAKVTLNGTERTATKDVQDIEAMGHDTHYADNGDGTHRKYCAHCDMNSEELHTYKDDVCELCGSHKPEKGDVNNDGMVDITDALLVTDYYIGKQEKIHKYAADMNDDGVIDMADVVLIIDKPIITNR